MPNYAILTFVKGQWHLDISGSDNAELYLIAYVFDGRRVLARELYQGPDSSEKTRYDIEVDPDLTPQVCHKTESSARRAVRKPHGRR